MDALPLLLGILGREHLTVGHLLKERKIALLMLYLHLGNKTEKRCDFRKSLIFGSLCEVGIQVTPFLALAGSSLAQIGHGVGHYPCRVCGIDGDHAPLKLIKKHGSVGELLLGCDFKHFGYLTVTFLLGLLGKEGIAVAGLAFTGKCS